MRLISIASRAASLFADGSYRRFGRPTADGGLIAGRLLGQQSNVESLPLRRRQTAASGSADHTSAYGCHNLQMPEGAQVIPTSHQLA